MRPSPTVVSQQQLDGLGVFCYSNTKRTRQVHRSHRCLWAPWHRPGQGLCITMQSHFWIGPHLQAPSRRSASLPTLTSSTGPGIQQMLRSNLARQVTLATEGLKEPGQQPPPHLPLFLGEWGKANTHKNKRGGLCGLRTEPGEEPGRAKGRSGTIWLTPPPTPRAITRSLFRSTGFTSEQNGLLTKSVTPPDTFPPRPNRSHPGQLTCCSLQLPGSHSGRQ